MTKDAQEPSAQTVRDIVERHLDREGPLLPILHDIQAAFGHVPESALEPIAHALNLTRAEVHGVMSFYHDFRDRPAGRHVVKICRAEACQSMGADALSEGVLDRLGIDWHGTTKNGAVTIDPVYCLGLCACAPAVMVDSKVVGRVDLGRMNRLLDEAGA